MTVLDRPGKPDRDVPPKPIRVAWKLIVAAEAPWTGEVYSTRPGRDRSRFSTVETFCAALLTITGWPLHAHTDGANTSSLGHRPSAARPSRSRVGRAESALTRKFIVAADQPWIGEMYRTRPGLGHLQFGTFEEFLLAVLHITGWSLECTTHSDEDRRMFGPTPSRHVSGGPTHDLRI